MRIGIIGAMDEEVQILKEKLGDYTTENIGGSEFYIGKVDGKEIILLRSGIGKVNAAVATTLLIQLYSPDYVINTGSAGGFNPSLKVGDIVISTELRYHDVDATVFGYEYGQVPGMPAAYFPDDYLVNLAQISEKSVDVNIVSGLITSSDSFMSDIKRVNQVKEQFPKVYAAEMEATAIAQVCYQFKKPFLIIRSLSDIAGKDAKMSYDEFLETASVNSANFVLQMLESIEKTS